MMILDLHVRFEMSFKTGKWWGPAFNEEVRFRGVGPTRHNYFEIDPSRSCN